MISAIFTNLTSGANSFINFLKDLFQSVIAIFYTAPTGSETTGTLTDLGILLVTAISVGFVYMGIRWITKLIKFRA